MRKLINGQYVKVDAPADAPAVRAEVTGKAVAAIAAKGVKSPEKLSRREVKALAGSALTQAAAKPGKSQSGGKGSEGKA